MAVRHEPFDISGHRIKIGDLVRVLGVPDLGGMHPDGVEESAPVFAHIVGRYKRVAGFNEIGEVELFFRILRGPQRGLHSVWIEPWLLRVRRRKK